MHGWADLWHPGVLAWVALVQVAYLLAVGPWRQAFRWGAPATLKQKIYFSVGIWLVYVAEGTPIHILAENYLFSVHMIQHIILTQLTPLFVLLGVPAWMVRPLIRWRPMYWIARVVTHPVPALLLFNLVYSIWHMPMAYQATLWWHWFHMIQHAILVVTAVFMWWPVASPLPELPQSAPGVKMFYIFLLGLAQIAVFGVITFADKVLYNFYAQAPRIFAWLTPEIDQQLSGIIMKVGGMAVFIVVWAVVFFTWARQEGAHWDRSGGVPSEQ